MRKCLIFALFLMIGGCSSSKKKDIDNFMIQMNAKARKREYQLHPKWSDSLKAKLNKGIIEIGMTKDMVIAARGIEEADNQLMTSQGRTDQMVYNKRSGNFIISTLYIYLRNDTVSAIQRVN